MCAATRRNLAGYWHKYVGTAAENAARHNRSPRARAIDRRAGVTASAYGSGATNTVPRRLSRFRSSSTTRGGGGIDCGVTRPRITHARTHDIIQYLYQFALFDDDKDAVREKLTVLRFCSASDPSPPSVVDQLRVCCQRTRRTLVRRAPTVCASYCRFFSIPGHRSPRTVFSILSLSFFRSSAALTPSFLLDHVLRLPVQIHHNRRHG